MSDQFETRIRSFVVELLDDPPAPPPFPQPGVVVIDGRTRNGSTMTDTKTKPAPQKSAPSKRRGLGIAAAAFAAIVVAIVATVALTSGDEGVPAVATTSTTVADATTTSEATTTTALSGPALEGASGVVGLKGVPLDGPGTEPDSIHFNDDGTYRVVDQFRTIDTGVYTTNGDEITFESLVENQALDYVDWVFQPENPFGRSACADVVGSYTLTWLTSTRFVLNVIGDTCGRRIGVANGLEVEVEVP